MLRAFQLLLPAILLCVGCASAPARLPVVPEPSMKPGYWPDECRTLGEMTYMKHEGKRPPYGWTLLRLDVEHGVVTHVEILDSSPKGAFDDAALAVYGNVRYASLASAKGCTISHKWD